MPEKMPLPSSRTGEVTLTALTLLHPTLCLRQVSTPDAAEHSQKQALDVKYAHVDLLLAHRIRPADIKVVAALGDSITVSLNTTM